jgi:hypothetical protein
MVPCRVRVRVRINPGYPFAYSLGHQIDPWTTFAYEVGHKIDSWTTFVYEVGHKIDSWYPVGSGLGLGLTQGTLLPIAWVIILDCLLWVDQFGLSQFLFGLVYYCMHILHM